MTHPISTYLDSLKKKLATGVATEHTYRGTLAVLFESLSDPVRAINEPSRVACGSPDLVILHGDLKVGHVEAKDIGAALNMAENFDQLKRYRLALENLILTDYLEFRWYVDGGLRRSVVVVLRWHADGLVLTARPAAHRRARERVASEMIAMVSHEIRSPLTSVKGFTRTLLRRWDRFSDEQRKLMVATIDHDADRVTRLLRDLLEVRGLGVLNIRAMYGDSSIKRGKYLRLIIDLRDRGAPSPVPDDRMNGCRGEVEVLGLRIPLVSLPVAPGRNIAVMIEAAVRAHLLHLQGYAAGDDLRNRLRQQLQSGVPPAQDAPVGREDRPS